MRVQIYEKDMIEFFGGILDIVSEKLVELMREQLREKDAIATGYLYESFEVKRGRTLTERIVENKAPYSAILEFGCPPHRPPYEAILNWVKIKKHEIGEDAEKAAWRIVKKIEKEGYDPRFYARDALRKMTKRTWVIEGEWRVV